MPIKSTEENQEKVGEEKVWALSLNLQTEETRETPQKLHGSPAGGWELLRSVGQYDRGGRMASSVV